jgi:Tol biopolymer transport system component
MVSSDCRLMVFAAQQKQNDIWQIWEMDLVKRKYRKITALQDNCTDPVLLPNGRVIFTRQTSLDSATMGHALYSCNSDGSDLKQITFHPHANFATSVLKDGRLLTISRQLIPVTAGPMLMVLRLSDAEQGFRNNGRRNIFH